MSENPAPKSSPGGRMALAIILGLLALPAAAIACFATCLMTAETAGWGANQGPVWVGGIFAVLTLAAMFYLAIRIGRGSRGG